MGERKNSSTSVGLNIQLVVEPASTASGQEIILAFAAPFKQNFELPSTKLKDITGPLLMRPSTETGVKSFRSHRRLLCKPSWHTFLGY